MSVFIPSSFVKLVNVKLDPSYINTVNFPTKNARDIAFSTITGLNFNDFTFQRDNNIIRIPSNIDNIINYNYCYYDNVYLDTSNDYSVISTRKVYCFIYKMEYINDNVTAVFIKTDVFMTWFNDLNIGVGFVEREHINYDTLYSNFINEGLDTGEFVQSNLIEYDLNNSAIIALATIRDPEDYELYDGEIKSGLYNQIKWESFDFSDEGAEQLTQKLKIYNLNGGIDNVIDIIIMPSKCINLEDDFIILSEPTNVDGYEPKNKKLLSFPFSYLEVSNNHGITNVYKWEYMNDRNWEIKSSLSTNPALTIIPVSYKGKILDTDEGMILTNFPHCPWTEDSFKTWYALNINSINSTKSNLYMRGITNAVSSGINLTNEIFKSGPLMGTIKGSWEFWKNLEPTIEQLQAFQASLDDKELTPNALQGNYTTNNSSLYWNKWKFSFRYMSISHVYAERLDKYFDMFGYKTMEVKIPNINGRPAYNYVKVNHFNITGNCPMDDLLEIKSAFSTGITFWHNSLQNIGNYFLNNQNEILNILEDK